MAEMVSDLRESGRACFLNETEERREAGEKVWRIREVR